MTLEQAVLEGLKELPTEKQQGVLDFVDFLRHRWKQSDPPVEGNPTAHYPLQGTVLYYHEPFEALVPITDWDTLA